MLYAIIFLNGAALMCLEMVGSRILAPTFGTSINVWGALISTVMAAMTAGYYLGGVGADRYPPAKALSLIFAVTGVFIGSMPLWTGVANPFFLSNFPQAGSLFASMAYFFIPSLLMAMVSPFGVKMAGRNLNTLGNTAGRLLAVGSAGSIFGTLLTSFWLVPSFGVRNIIGLLGVVLLVLAGASFLFEMDWKKGSREVWLLIGLVGVTGNLLLLWIIFPGQASACREQAEILMVKDSLYHRIIVDQAGRERHLHFDNSYQSAMDLDNPKEPVFEYEVALHLGVAARPNPRRVLFIGLGGGRAPLRFKEEYPSLEKIDMVEIDPEVVRTARRYFVLPEDRRARAVVQDGRIFVEKTAQAIAKGQAQPYDMVIIDAFNADTVPFHLTTREFIRAVRGVLAPGGVMTMNIIGGLSGYKGRLVPALARTAEAVFAEAYLFPVYRWNDVEDTSVRNVILIAADHPRRWDQKKWESEVSGLKTQGRIREDLPLYAANLIEETVYRRLITGKNVPVLTDDFAPTDTW